MRRDVQATQLKGKSLIVCGMHRSGTSAMARVLALAGGAMPDRLIRAASDNPRGFWEPEEMVSLNDEIFSSVGSTWNDPFGFRMIDRVRAKGEDFLPRARSVVAGNHQGARLPVAKDPRTSLLAPLWRDAFEAEGFEPVFVIMARHPLEVARSISARDEATEQASTLAWLSHLVAIERDTRDTRRVFVAYDDLLADWKSTLDRIRSELAIELPVSQDSQAAISEFLLPTDRHHTVDEEDLIARADIWPGVKAAWSWLRAAARAERLDRPFPKNIIQELTSLEACLGPILVAEQVARQKNERIWQAVLSDREVQILRLRAQADEYLTAQARLIDDQRETLERLTAQGASDVEQLTGRLGTMSAAEDAAKAMCLELTAALDATRAELEQVSGALAEGLAAADVAKAMSQESQEALDATRAELEQVLNALADERRKTARLSLDRADISASLESTMRRVEELEAHHSQLEKQVFEGEMALRRLASIQTSASWAVARPLRVLEKRYKSILRRD